MDLLPINARSVLEISRRTTSVKAAYLRRNPRASYRTTGDWPVATGLAEDSAAEGGQIPDVIVIVRPPSAIELELVLANLRRQCRQRTVCVIAVDNPAHWPNIKALLQGQRRDERSSSASSLADLDQLRLLVQKSGWRVNSVQNIQVETPDARLAVDTLVAAAEALGVDAASARNSLSVKSWLLTCTSDGAEDRETLVALTLKKVAGVNEARVDHPLRALKTLGCYNLAWGNRISTLPGSWQPGVFILHRTFLNDPNLVRGMENLIDRGWVIVSDIDDDPHHWQGFRDNDFFAFRGVHGVTVSTEPLAEVVRQWNPNVQVLGNAIFELPEVSGQSPKQGDRLRVFFGALNRSKDWAKIQPAVIRAIEEAGRPVELVIVHDKAVYDSIPEQIAKSFHPTLGLNEYMTVLGSCDLALLPLEDTAFNRLKSDLKFIECCAAGVVPICSPVVYAERAEHLAVGCFAATQEQWYGHLLRLIRQPQELADRRRKGWDYVTASRMHTQQVGLRQQFYRSLMARRDQLEVERRARLQLRPSS